MTQLTDYDDSKPAKGMVINPDGTPVIDLDQLTEQQAAFLVTPARPANLVPRRTPSVASVIPDELEVIYTETIPAMIRESLRDGTAAIIALVTVTTGVAIATVVTMYFSLMAAVGFVSASLPMIILSLGAVALIPILLRGKRHNGTIVVKGCPKGPTPGSHVIRR